MRRCYEVDGYGRKSQPSASQRTQPPVVSIPMLMCTKCGTPLDGHEMFGECFPQEVLGESPPLAVRDGRIVAV